MKSKHCRAWSILVLGGVALSAVAAGCTKTKLDSKTQGGADVIISHLGEPEWKTTFKAECDGSAAGCIAGHGFTLLADGRYIVGPSPDGQVIEGLVAPEEFERVNTLLQKTEDSIQNLVEPEESCSPATPENDGTRDTVTANFRGKEFILARKTLSDFCHKLLPEEDAFTLRDLLGALADRYYPVEFPSDCTQAVTQIQKIQQSIVGCTTDLDCSYVDNVYQPITSGDIQFVLTDNCTSVPALAVANHESLISRQDEILSARESARNACGVSFYKQSCFLSGFQASIAPPACVNGACRVNPAVYSR